MKECVNCGNMCNTPYCPVCGQKMEVTRVSLSGITTEFFSKWIGLDTQFGRTVVGMILHPGEVINSYLKGNRTKHIGPLGFLVVMSALVIISFDVFGLAVEDFLDQNQSTFKEALGQGPNNDRQLQIQQIINEFLAKNFRFFSAIMIPFWALSFWFFYRSARLNYIERVVVAIYMSGESMWITIAMLGIFALTGHLFNVYAFAISLMYYAYCLHRTFPAKNILLSIIKSLGSFIVAFLLCVILAGIALAGVLLVMVANTEGLGQGG